MTELRKDAGGPGWVRLEFESGRVAGRPGYCRMAHHQLANRSFWALDRSATGNGPGPLDVVAARRRERHGAHEAKQRIRDAEEVSNLQAGRGHAGPARPKLWPGRMAGKRCALIAACRCQQSSWLSTEQALRLLAQARIVGRRRSK